MLPSLSKGFTLAIFLGLLEKSGKKIILKKRFQQLQKYPLKLFQNKIFNVVRVKAVFWFQAFKHFFYFVSVYWLQEKRFDGVRNVFLRGRKIFCSEVFSLKISLKMLPKNTPDNIFFISTSSVGFFLSFF